MIVTEFFVYLYICVLCLYCTCAVLDFSYILYCYSLLYMILCVHVYINAAQK